MLPRGETGARGAQGERGERGRRGQRGVGLGVFVAGITLAAIFSFMAARQVQLVEQTTKLRDQAAVLQRQYETAAETHAVLCAYKKNVVSQRDGTARYLRMHPEGFPALGITAAQLKSQLDRQNAAVKSLSGLDCGR